jgi:hypothetical protein
MSSSEEPPKIVPQEDKVLERRKQFEQKCLDEIKNKITEGLPALYQMTIVGQKKLAAMIRRMELAGEDPDKVQLLKDEESRRTELLKPENSDAFKAWQVEVYEKEFFLRRKAGLVYFSALKDIFDKGQGRRPEIGDDVEIQVDNDVVTTLTLGDKGVALRYGSPNWEHAKLWAQRRFLDDEVLFGDIYNGDVIFHVTPNGAEQVRREGIVQFDEWLSIIESKFTENGLDFRRQENMMGKKT